MLPLDIRPGVRSIPSYNGSVVEHLTVYDNKGNSFKLRGEMALREYKDTYRGLGHILYHGTFKSPHEIGFMIKPQQAFSRHNTDQFAPHGRQAISASDSHKFPIVRSLFHRESPAFREFPKNEFLLANISDVTGREITIVTSKGLEAVKNANSTGYVYVLHQNQLDGTRAERFKETDGIGHEYRFYYPATPVFVMPVTVQDLPWSTAIVHDTELANKIHENRNRVTVEYFAYGNNIQDIFGDPFFENTYYSF